MHFLLIDFLGELSTVSKEFLNRRPLGYAVVDVLNGFFRNLLRGFIQNRLLIWIFENFLKAIFTILILIFLNFQTKWIHKWHIQSIEALHNLQLVLNAYNFLLLSLLCFSKWLDLANKFPQLFVGLVEFLLYSVSFFKGFISVLMKICRVFEEIF